MDGRCSTENQAAEVGVGTAMTAAVSFARGDAVA